MNSDRINEHYFGDLAQPGTQRCRQRIHWICGHVTGEHILDIGCSQGVVCLILAREGFCCTGVDIEQPALDHAVRELEKEDESVRSRVNFQVTNASSLPFSNEQFDTVILGEILEHLTHPEKVLREACRVLKDGGSLIVTVPFGLLPFHDHKQTYYPLSLIEQLEPFVEIAQLEFLDGYVAVRGSKTSHGAGQDLHARLRWLEKITRLAESHFAKCEFDYYYRISQLTQAVGTSNSKIQELNKKTSDLKDEIVKRQRSLETVSAQLQEKTKEISDLKTAIASAKLQYGEKLKAEAELKVKIAEYCGELRAVTGRHEVQADEIASLRQKHVQSENDWRQKLKESEARFETAKADWQNKLQVVESKVVQGEVEIERLHKEHQFALAQKAEHLKALSRWSPIRRLISAYEVLRNSVNLSKVGRKQKSQRSTKANESVTIRESRELQIDKVIENIRLAVLRTIPVGSIVAVISRGDERLLEFVGRTGLHFPQTANGTYAGHYPANGAEAIAHLDDLVLKGTDYLLIPSTSFWWLDYYSELREYLASKHHLVGFQDDTCMIFALQSRPSELTHSLPLYYEPKANGRRAANGQGSHLKGTATCDLGHAWHDLKPPKEDDRTLNDEHALYHPSSAKTPADSGRVLLYGNVNTNVIDGSSVWLINVAKLLSSRYKVDLLLKAKITSRYLLSELEGVDNINIISPDDYPLHMKFFGDSHYLEDYSAAELIAKLDMENNYHFVFCRGKFVNYYLSLNANVNHKLVAYFLIDYYKSEQHALDVEVSLLQNIIYNAAVVVAQTQMLKDFVCKTFHCPGDNIVLLPPMVTKCIDPGQSFINRNNVCLYAGKFDLEWRVDDIINVCEREKCKLQLVGNKFHAQLVGEQLLKAWIMEKAQAADNIEYLGVIDHKDMPAKIDASDFSISVRTDRYLASKEFSTKILEFGARGKPTIMNDSPINRVVVGDDYPLFANTNDELAECLGRVMNPEVYARAASMCFEAARRSQIDGLTTICEEIEQHLRVPAQGPRIAVISDDKNYCDSFEIDQGRVDACRTVKVLCPRMPEIKHNPIRRLLWWADIINVHVQRGIDQEFIRLFDDVDKVIVSNGARNLGLSREVALREPVSYDSLLAHSNSIDVSVIVPCWNVAPPLLRRALDSVLNQNGLGKLSWEIVIVDDASDSPLVEVLPATYRNNKNIRIVRNHRNKGLGISRNIGFEQSRGQNIFFLDADDYYGEGFFAGMLPELKKHDVVLGKMLIHREDDGVYEADNYINHALAELKERAVHLRKVITAVHACVKGYRRSTIENGRLYYLTGYHEDVYPWFRFILEHKDRITVGYSELAIYYRTIRQGSNQITMDLRIAGARLMDLSVARVMVLTLLRQHNSGGEYNHLIAWYERLLRSTQSNGERIGPKVPEPLARNMQSNSDRSREISLRSAAGAAAL